MRVGLPVAVMLSLLGARAPAQADLFSCREIVTGTDPTLHPDAIERCVRDVAVKLTGQPSIAEDKRLDTLVADASTLIEDYVYLDRMSDIPMHDEQGTRERPYDLIAHLDPERVRAGLRAAGLTPWPDRPALLVRVSVVKDDARFALDADSVVGERQRQSLLSAGKRFGMRVVLPTRAQVASGQTPRVRGGQATLSGELIWSPAAFGWIGRWRLDGDAWEIAGVSFDAAFRSGVGGAVARLSRP